MLSTKKVSVFQWKRSFSSLSICPSGAQNDEIQASSQPFLASGPFLGLLWASGPLPSLFWPPGPFVGFWASSQPFLAPGAFSGPFVGFGPLSSLFWLRGLFWASSQPFLGLGASSKLLDLLPAVFLMNLPNGCETNYLISLLRWRTWELAPLKFRV